MTYLDSAICNSTTKPVFVVLFLEILFHFSRPGQDAANETKNYA